MNVLVTLSVLRLVRRILAHFKPFQSSELGSSRGKVEISRDVRERRKGSVVASRVVAQEKVPVLMPNVKIRRIILRVEGSRR